MKISLSDTTMTPLEAKNHHNTLELLRLASFCTGLKILGPVTVVPVQVWPGAPLKSTIKSPQTLDSKEFYRGVVASKNTRNHQKPINLKCVNIRQKCVEKGSTDTTMTPLRNIGPLDQANLYRDIRLDLDRHDYG